MTKAIERAARYLANQPYTTVIGADKTTDGKDIFLARNPQLYGCMAQGFTEEEALDSLLDARVDYIASLLEDGELVPTPFTRAGSPK